jgi:hypothetical protein
VDLPDLLGRYDPGRDPTSQSADHPEAASGHAFEATELTSSPRSHHAAYNNIRKDMIVSHLHRFIYIKPTKVAGTSVEVALSSICGDDDIVTPQREFSAVFDKDRFRQRARNHEGFSEHMLPKDIKERVGDSVWNSYRKIAVVRNPWDYVVSRYLWEYTKMYRADKYRTLYLRFKHVFLRIWFKLVKRQYIYSIFSFESFTHSIPEPFLNQNYYFDSDGEPYCDIILRYETLQTDFEALCNLLGVPAHKLPQINTRHKKKRRDYRSFYNDVTKQNVAERLAKEIAYFGYTFDGHENNSAPAGRSAYE